jgi:hypothetical protein
MDVPSNAHHDKGHIPVYDAVYFARYSICTRNQRAVSIFVGNYGESRTIRKVDKCLPHYIGSHRNLQYSLYVEVIPVPARNVSLCNRVPHMFPADVGISALSYRMYTRDHMPGVDSILW